jgi:photosystem II stability/assembly factor-like uncharacterized protein
MRHFLGHYKFQVFCKLSITLFLLGMAGCNNKNNNSEDGKVTPVDTVGNVVSPAIIYRSTDAGQTWVPFDKGVPHDATVSSFLIVNDKIIAATDYHGIYSIREGDTKWKRIDEDLPIDVDINTIAAIGNSLIIGTLSHGMMISSNNGVNWEDYSFPYTKTPIRCLYTKRNLLFAGADNGIYRSVNNGLSWEHVYKGVQVNGFTELKNKISAALMNGAIETNDDGLHWNYVYEPHTLHDISSDGERLYAMTLGAGLKASSDGGQSWEVINNGLGTKNLYTFEVKRLGNKIFAAQWYGIYTSDNFGKDWTIIKTGLPDSTAFSTLEVMNSGLIAGIGLRKK